MGARRSLYGLLLLVLAAPDARAGDDDGQLRLTLEAPERGSVIATSEGRALVAGQALAVGGRAGAFDVIVVIDTSKSTAAPSGADVDGDGRVGAEMGARKLPVLGKLLDLSSDDRGDSILAAEVAAARTLLAQLDPRSTRVGIVAFAGDTNPDTRDAFTAVPLTSNFRKLEHGLARLLEEGPHGKTNLEAAVREATNELGGGVSAASEPREGARKVVLFMTDGQPTLPVRRASHRNKRLAVAAAEEAAALGIRIDTFAIGEEATSDPEVTLRMAEVSDGVFTAVEDPRDLIASFEDIDLAALERVEIWNETTGERAEPLLVDADGAFSGLVPLAPGPNLLAVRARADDGSQGELRVPVTLLPDDGLAALPARLLERRRLLLENQYLEARRRRLELEAARAERVRRELVVEIEAARGPGAEGPRTARRSLSVAPEPGAHPPASPAP